MDTQKRIIVWVSLVLVLVVIGFGVWSAATQGPQLPTGATSSLIELPTPTDHTKGATNPKVTLVEYADFQCPACGAYYPFIEKIYSDNKEVLAFTYREFPLTQHLNANPAARAAEAAGMQGKFWEMHDMLFANQETWEASKTPDQVFEGYAQTLELDMERFKADRDSQAVKDRIAHDHDTGVASGVQGTPTFYVNGKKIEKYLTAEEFDALIKEAAQHND